ncbi:MAG: hypothetical protein FD147_925 [Chloroflexi bacterium]|nr:MAG: hypothetical protein FD147_925 [Chloroflexota bacterium]
MGIALAFPIIFLLIILQTTIAGQITLLSGSTDLVLLWLSAWAIQGRVKSAWFWAILGGVCVAFISAIPFYIPIISYSATTFFARMINKRVWQSPLLMMFVVTILGSLLLYFSSYAAMTVNGISMSWKTSLIEIIIPSTLLNLFFSIPMYAIVKDTAQWAYPLEVNE